MYEECFKDFKTVFFSKHELLMTTIVLNLFKNNEKKNYVIPFFHKIKPEAEKTASKIDFAF